MKKGTGEIKLFGVILSAVAAMIWTANCIVLAIYGGNAAPVRIVLIVDVVCAVIWWAVFLAVVLLRRKGRARQVDQTGGA